MNPDPPPIRLGLLGAARIAPAAVVYPTEHVRGVELRCIAARDPERAAAFAAEHRIGTALPDYRAVIDADVDAVYIALPISAHAEWTIAALEAGRHVLCEKALACNAAEARRMADAARAADRVLMDAYHYRYHPLFARVLDLLVSGAVGRVRRLDGEFRVPHVAAGDIRLDYATGGGALMDIGCYPLHWLRHVTGAEPTVRSASARTGPADVDLIMEAAVEFPNGVEGRIRCSFDPTETMAARLVVEGEAGTLTVTNPVAPQMGHELRLVNGDGDLREQVDRTPTYVYQLEAFAAAVRGNRAANLTDGEDGVAQMTAIDAIYAAAGLPLRGLRPA